MAKKREKAETQWFIRPKGPEANAIIAHYLTMLQRADEQWGLKDQHGISRNFYRVDSSLITELLSMLRTSGSLKMFDIFNRKGANGQIRNVNFLVKQRKKQLKNRNKNHRQ